MSSSINTSYPQAPLVVPKPVSRPMSPTSDADGDNDGSKGVSSKAPVASAQIAKPVLPTDAPSGMVNLKA